MCIIDNCLICELGRVPSDCKHNHGLAVSVFGAGLYCVACGESVEIVDGNILNAV